MLAALSPDDGDVARWVEASEKKSGDGRPGLAHWLTNVDDGAGTLAARVIVNRLWQHHFGVGLVKTSDNFGRVGDKPTHPKLLDWLAGELIRAGWKLKPIHRLIMTSAVYTQDTTWDKKRHDVDPENKLMSRRQPRRVQAEILRDSIMNTDGTLNLEEILTLFEGGPTEELAEGSSILIRDHPNGQYNGVYESQPDKINGKTLSLIHI